MVEMEVGSSRASLWEIRLFSVWQGFVSKLVRDTHVRAGWYHVIKVTESYVELTHSTSDQLVSMQLEFSLLVVSSIPSWAG